MASGARPEVECLKLILWLVLGCEGTRAARLLEDSPPTAVGREAGVPSLEASTSQLACDGAPLPGSVCGCDEIPLVVDAPTLYFVLDRSGSMGDADRYGSVRLAATEVVRRLGPRIRVGAAVFPSPSGGNCAAGTEVLAPRAGDAPSSSPGPTTRAFLTALNLVPSGGTPLSATLRALSPRLVGEPGRTYVVVATDGGPNCNADAVCDTASCIPNIEGQQGCTSGGENCCTAERYGTESCLDSSATSLAARELSHSGVPVFVIGVPGSAPYAAALGELAVSGGTARSGEVPYYKVDRDGTEELGRVLSAVAASVTATCTFPLSQSVADPSLVNVYLDDRPLPASGSDGFTLEEGTIRLWGGACEDVQEGRALGIRVVQGCATYVPP